MKRMKISAFVFATTFLLSMMQYSNAQTENPPSIDWFQSDIWPNNYPNDNSTPIPREKSGEDWLYDITTSKNDQGITIGYASVGYSINPTSKYNVSNNYHSACESTIPGETNSCEMFRKNVGIEYTYPFLHFTDLEGNSGSTKPFFLGQIKGSAYGIVQSSINRNHYFICGSTSSSFDQITGDLLKYNSSINNQTSFFTNCSSGEVFKNKGYVIKYNKESDQIEWINLYGYQNKENALNAFSTIKGISETADGNLVIYGQERSNSKVNYFAKKINQSSGNITHNFLLESTNENGATANSKLSVIKSTVENGHEIYYSADVYNSASSNSTTFVTKFSENGIIWSIDIDNNNERTKTTDLCIDNNGDIIIPVLTQIGSSELEQNKGVANAKIFKVSKINGQIKKQTEKFGEFRAFDLMMGITATKDGGFAIVSTSQNRMLSRDLIMNTNPASLNYCPDFKLPYTYYLWNTNAYVAKFDRNMNKLWEKTFDVETPTPYYKYENRSSTTDLLDNIDIDHFNFNTKTDPINFPQLNKDVKRQECLYRIVESSDGGLVICGNNSMNVDDGYLVKLAPTCQSPITLENNNFIENKEILNNRAITIKNNTYNSNNYLTIISGESITITTGTHKALAGANIKLGVDETLHCNYNPEQAGNNSRIGLESLVDEKQINPVFLTGLNIYPNPTQTGELNMEFRSEYIGKITVKIQNTHGIIASEETFEKLEETFINLYNLSNYPNGIYIIQIICANEVHSAKIIKTN